MVAPAELRWADKQQVVGTFPVEATYLDGLAAVVHIAWAHSVRAVYLAAAYFAAFVEAARAE
jgi:hypothetical protein